MNKEYLDSLHYNKSVIYYLSTMNMFPFCLKGCMDPEVKQALLNIIKLRGDDEKDSR